MRLSKRVGTVVLVVGLVAAACSGGSKSGSGGSTTSSGGSSTGSGGSASAGTPKVGGNLIMGTEAEIDGFDPTQNRWDTTGIMYAFTVYDPLAAFGKDNQVHPYLAQSINHSPDYKTWTITLRPNVSFSNGDPLTGADVAQDLNAIHASSLTGPVFNDVKSIEATGPLTVEVDCITPWVPFPVYLTGQTGTVFDPVMLKDPNRAQHPIGTGPFILKEWEPGNHFLATRNPNYWQKGLPYLDSIEYRPIIDEQSRESSLQTGTIQLFHSSDPQATYNLKGKSGITIIDESKAVGQQSQDFIMLNTGKAPLNDPTLRQALAYATNTQQIINVINYGLTPSSDGPFSNTGSPFHGPSGYPAYNLAKAKQLVQQYEQAHGVTSVSFQLGTTNTGRNLQTAELVQSMWKQAGITTTIVQVEQSQLILFALEGNYNAYLWRQFGDPDPDADYVWWSTGTAAAEGQLALNFARNKDPQIQADLDKGRSDPNQADRVAAYQDVAKRFAVDVPYLWVNQTLWQIVYSSHVHGITSWTLPDGSPGVDHTIGGTFFMSHVWTS
jgi:peptide/nickel transport system substrate-binding protein